MFRRVYAFLFLLLALSYIAYPFSSANAQDIRDLTQIQTELEAKQEELKTFEPILLDTTLDDETLFNTRQSVKLLRSRSQEIQGLIAPLNLSVIADIADIGESPNEDSGEVEPENIRELREELNKESLIIKGILKQAEALGSKSTRFLEQLAAMRRGQFVEKILENSVSPFNARLWAELHDDKNQALIRVSEGWSKFLNDKTAEEKKSVIDGLLFMAGLFLFVFVLFVMVNTRILRRSIITMEAPTFHHRLRKVGAGLVVSMTVGFFCLSMIFIAAQKQGVIDDNNLNESYIFFAFILFVMYALTKAVMLVFAGGVRKKVGFLIITAITLYAVDYVLLAIGRQFGIPVELVIVQSFAATTLFSAILLIFSIALVRKQEERRAFLFKRRFFYVSALMGVMIFIANALGYVALTRFVFEQTVLLTNFAIAVFIIRATFRPIISWADHFFYQNPDKDDNLAFFWLSLLMDTALFVVSIPLVATIVGVEWEGVKLLIYQALSGFEIAGITVSLTNMASAIMVFMGLLFLTRFMQKILAQKVLPKTRMEEAVRLSFVQIVGYVGLTVALMVGISSVGFDLSNLALIAGALSVGIGFGLQSIVSNFVSGLILLFERPIKVGDWVILNAGEGVVKKISVRATEIETLDRTAIIIPNSEFISSSVKNWTHKDRIGRLVITVGVSYNSDPQKVYDILLDVAKSNEFVLSSPLPTVHFKDFGDSALIFDLRIFMRNVTDRFVVGTRIRLDIWSRLKEEGIEIPFPQRDIHIKSADGLDMGITTKKATKLKKPA